MKGKSGSHEENGDHLMLYKVDGLGILSGVFLQGPDTLQGPCPVRRSLCVCFPDPRLTCNETQVCLTRREWGPSDVT